MSLLPEYMILESAYPHELEQTINKFTPDGWVVNSFINREDRLVVLLTRSKPEGKRPNGN